MKKILSILTVLMLFSGCAKKEVKPLYITVTKEKKFNCKEVDEKIVVDNGKVLRILINSYKDKNEILTPAHFIYIWAKKPAFSTKRFYISNCIKDDNGIERENSKDD